MVNKEGMDEKKRDPYQITLFRGIPSSSRNKAGQILTRRTARPKHKSLN